MGTSPAAEPAALGYTERGYRLLPLWWPTEVGPTPKCACPEGYACRNVGKHPIGKLVPKGLKDASSDPSVVASWLRRYPRANIGLATGAGILVWDVDPRHDGDASLNEIEAKYGPLRTLTADTGGGGWHFVFRTQESVGCATGILPGIDARGDGGYICVWPSLHPSGRRWRWRTDVREIAPGPQWLIDLTRRSRAQTVRAAVLDERIPEGRRETALTSLAGSMRRRGLVAEEILPALHAVNDRRCAPPLPESALVRIAHSVERYDVAAPIGQGGGRP